MTLVPGKKLGPYEVLGPLGAGGMGEVYRARDTRLGRDVAVKVLPQHLSANAEVRARFEREAKTVSSLNHPHICTLFDVGREGETDYLVMELVDGETLAQRLAKGALPAADVLRLGSQVADALDRAHRAGVIHRDLKPGNVMLTRSGAKLMDFGLARATGMAGPAGGSGITHAALTQSPTIAGPLTAEGTIVGTFQYMSPEQLEGKEADARSDIWALGCVLYEMASGRRAFDGASQASLIGAIMNAAPRPLSEIAPMLPPELDRLVRQCLARDPDDRWQSARDLGRELAALATPSVNSHAQDLAGRRAAPAGSRLAWATSAVLLALLLAGGAYLLLFYPHADAGPVVSSILPPPGLAFGVGSGAMALSPDGRRIAFVAEDSLGGTSIWTRSLDSAEPRPVPGTSGAQMLFWSPDGRDIGYFADSQLRRIGLAGGSSQVVTAAPSPGGGTWTRDGFIVFAGARFKGIQRVPATGGECTSVLDTARTPVARAPVWPVVLPDGRHLLFVYAGSATFKGVQDGVYLSPLDGREKPRMILPGATVAQYVEPGRLIFWREGALWEQSFDARALRLTGAAVQIADHVLLDSWLGSAFFSTSAAGELVYLSGGSNAGLAEMVWVDRAGRDLGQLGPPANYYAPRISHNGRRVAVDRSDPVTGEGDIWIFDVARALGDRFTSNPQNETSPVWSADDSRLYWMSAVGAGVVGDVHVRTLDGVGAEETLTHRGGALTRPIDASPDGGSLLFQTRAADISSARSLWLMDLASHGVTPWSSSSGSEGTGRVSRDGKWIAVVSSETGEDEVYVERFPQGGEKWRVSTSGGRGPVWREDGRELFYYSSGDRLLMSVRFDPQPVPVIGSPVPLFRTRLREFFSEAYYDAMADGQKFLLTRPVQGDNRASFTLVQGWRPSR